MAKRGAPWWCTGHDDQRTRRRLRERTVPPVQRRHRWCVLRWRIHWPVPVYTATRLFVGRNGAPWPKPEPPKWFLGRFSVQREGS